MVRSLDVPVRVCVIALAVGGCVAWAGPETGVLHGPKAEIEQRTELWRKPREREAARTRATLDFSSFQPTDAAPDSDGPTSVAMTPDGLRVVVAGELSGNVTVHDAATGAALATIPVGVGPQDVEITPDGRYALTADIYNNTVSVVDLQSLRLVTAIPTGGVQPFDIEISADGTRAVVGCINDSVVSAFTVIDLSTMSVERSFPSAPQGVIGQVFVPENGRTQFIYTRFAVTPDGERVVLPDAVNTKIRVYALDTGAELVASDCPEWPTGVAIAPGGGFAVVTHENGVRRLSRLDLNTFAISGYNLAHDPNNQSVLVTPDQRYAVLTAGLVNVLFVDLVTAQTAATLAAGQPAELAAFPGGQRILVAGTQTTILDTTTRSIERVVDTRASDRGVAGPGGRAVTLARRTREELGLYLAPAGQTPTNRFVPAGLPPESDATRTLSLGADGTTIVCTNNVSANVGIWDLSGALPPGYVYVGDRPLDAAISADGSVGAAVAGDENRVVIFDASAGPDRGRTLARLTTPSRPARVRINSDATRAYVLCVDADVVAEVVLAGTASFIARTVPAGGVGQNLAYPYNEFSGMELSPDGLLLAVCDGLGDRLRLYDTDTFTLMASVPAGDNPIRVIFNSWGTRAYVASSNSDTVSIINVDGAASTLLATIPVAENPIGLTLDSTESYLYVAGGGNTNPGLSVIDLASNTSVRFLRLDGYRPRGVSLVPACGQLALACAGEFDDRVYRVRAEGPATSIVSWSPLSWSPSDQVFSRRLRTFAAAQPVFDGIDLVQFPLNADMDLDGAIDLADFFLFFTLFDLSHPEADLNGDGEVDLSDYFDFFESYDAGCR